ncbi:MAG TPA: potassium-transporting ATPase subunit KdpC [Spirochaetota bacterium]|nr:potassium-transporting ATPase subunit KdpC [Spirochaetota bacterium]
MGQLKISVLALLVFTIICGAVYPVVVTGAGYIFFRDKAAGSLLIKEGVIRGSVFIGQNFTRPEYFHGRPSAVSYDSSLSGGSNLGHTSSKLDDQVIKRDEALRKVNNLPADFPIPEDLLFASGSGLDPHISVDSALLQAGRIASERKVEVSDIENVIKQYSERQIPFYGKRFVNVLKLNAALDGMGVAR